MAGRRDWLSRLWGVRAGGSAEPSTPPPPHEMNRQPVSAIAEANNAFGLALYGRLREQAGNLFFSPFRASFGCPSLDAPVIPIVRADHPFLMAIRDKASGAILFLGRVADPTRE